MIPTGVEWVFPHGYKITEEHTGYELTCEGRHVSYNKDLGILLRLLGFNLRRLSS
jgi:hypothetical protein